MGFYEDESDRISRTLSVRDLCLHWIALTNPVIRRKEKFKLES